MTSFQNLLPVTAMGQRLTLREGQGILFKQGAIAATGNLAFLTVFTMI